MLGYVSPPGHDHDDNCLSTSFTCEQGHITKIFVRRRCSNPECDWVGKETCSCHPDKKIES